MNWNKILPAAVASAFLMSAGAASANEGSKTQEQAGTLPSEQSSTMAQTGQQEPVTLTVSEVDQATNKVTFEAELDPTAEVKKGGETIAVSDLQPGDSVRASFDPMTGEVQNLEVVEGSQQQPGMQPPSSTEPSPSPGMEEPMEEPGLGEPSY